MSLPGGNLSAWRTSSRHVHDQHSLFGVDPLVTVADAGNGILNISIDPASPALQPIIGFRQWDWSQVGPRQHDKSSGFVSSSSARLKSDDSNDVMHAQIGHLEEVTRAQSAQLEQMAGLLTLHIPITTSTSFGTNSGYFMPGHGRRRHVVDQLDESFSTVALAPIKMDDGDTSVAAGSTACADSALGLSEIAYSPELSG